MDRLRREINRLLTSAPASWRGSSTAGYPAMNVWTNEDGAIVTAELPGVEADSINISVTGDTLTLSGNREAEEVQEGATCHRRERKVGSFTRAFQLPFQVESNAVEALFKNGVLRISLPRAESDKPKKIAVKVG
jgi:HSP20 family protein